MRCGPATRWAVFSSRYPAAGGAPYISMRCDLATRWAVFSSRYPAAGGAPYVSMRCDLAARWAVVSSRCPATTGADSVSRCPTAGGAADYVSRCRATGEADFISHCLTARRADNGSRGKMDSGLLQIKRLEIKTGFHIALTESQGGIGNGSLFDAVTAGGRCPGPRVYSLGIYNPLHLGGIRSRSKRDRTSSGLQHSTLAKTSQSNPCQVISVLLSAVEDYTLRSSRIRSSENVLFPVISLPDNEGCRDNYTCPAQVIEELHSVWQLDEIIKNPLNAVLLCRLYEINQGLPDTFTAMFTKLVMGVVGWNCHRKGIEMKGEEIPSAVHQIIASLGHIAWEGLRNGLMSFDVSELRRCYPITNEILKFGFLMFVTPEEPCGQSLRCTFSHRVFQEIFSACYISTMARLTPDSELTAAYLRLCTQEGFQQVCIFVSGLLKDKAEILFQQLAEQIRFCSQLNYRVGAGTMNPLDDTLHLALLCLHETGEVDRFAPLVAMHFANRLFISDWSSKSCLQSIVSILQYQDSQQPTVEQETAADVPGTAEKTAGNDTPDSTSNQQAEENQEALETKLDKDEKSDSSGSKDTVEKMDTGETDTDAEPKTPTVEENKEAQDIDSHSGEGSNLLKRKADAMEGSDGSTENKDQGTDTQTNGTVESKSKTGDEEEMEIEIAKDQKKGKKELESEGTDGGKTTHEKDAEEVHGAEKDDGITKDAIKKKATKGSLQRQTQDTRTLRRGRSRTSTTLPEEREEKEDSDKEADEDEKADRRTSKKKGQKDAESSEEEDQQKGSTRSRTRQESRKDTKVLRKDKDNSECDEDQSPGRGEKTQESPRRSSRRKETKPDAVGTRTRSTDEAKKGSKVKSSADDGDDDKSEGYVDPIGSRTRRRTRSDVLQIRSDDSTSPKTGTRTSPRAKVAKRDKSSESEREQEEFSDPIGLRTRTRARGANVQSPSKEKKPSAGENIKESPEVDSQEEKEKTSDESEEETQEAGGEFIDPIGLRVRGRRAKSIAREQLRVIADEKFELRCQDNTRVSPRSKTREMPSPKSPGRPWKSSEGEGSEDKSRPGRRQSPKGEDRQKGPKIKWGKGVQGKGKSPPKPKKEEEEEKEDVREEVAEETNKEKTDADVKTQGDEEQQDKEDSGPEEEEEEDDEVLKEEPEEEHPGLHSLDISIFASNLQIVFRALRNSRIIRTLTFTDKFLPATRNICHLDWFDSLGELFLHNTNLRTLIIDSANYRVTRGAFTNVVTAAVTSKSLLNVQLKFELNQKAEKSSGYIRLGIPLEKLTESSSLHTVSVELTSKMAAHEEAANDVTRTIVKLLKKPSNLKKVSFKVKEKDSYFLQVLPVLRAMQVNSTISDFSIDMGPQPSTRYTLAAIKEVLTFNSGLTSLRVKFHTPAPVNSDDLTEVFTAVENSDLRAFTLDMGCGWSTDPLDPPVLALADLLANNTILRKLYVKVDCPWSPQAISNDTIALLCAALYANSTVKELHISGIYTAEDNGPKIIQALLKHKGSKFTIDMPYWWNAYCKVAADYCEGIVMEHYFDKDDTEGSEKKKKKKKKKDASEKQPATPKKEAKTAADSKEAKAGTSSTETKTAAESEEIRTDSESSESNTDEEGSPLTKSTANSTETKITEDSTKTSSPDKTNMAKLCPELSKTLTKETKAPKKQTEQEDEEARRDIKSKEGSRESREARSSKKEEGTKTPDVHVVEETPSCSGHSNGQGKAKAPVNPKPPVSSHPTPVSTKRTTAAALIQAGDDLPEFLNQFPEYKNARMIRSGRIMVNTEVDCLGSTGYGSGFLSDTFKLTEAGRKKLELIKTREAKNTVAVRETLFCSGKTNCQRECGGIGDCVRGCSRDATRGHRCSFRVKLHMYMDRLNFWEVTVEGEHLPSSTGQQWIPFNKHAHMYVQNGVWSTLDQ
ncbi:Hypp167 [Branchiostoma lanceolatum]|uniref:Hypp167 protein n=1 Tax=Branchiostoma lanceolatum TaxID=7740 RepID=A0A8J9VXY3_BRALA|nr:Hypp167 [Branchiostoma lanceolatum]